MQEIQLRSAKANLSAVIDKAMQGEPSIITRHGKPEAVIVSYEEWSRLSRLPTFADLLLASPLDDSDLPPREAADFREVDL